MSRPGVFVLALLSVTGCDRSREAQGERLARTYCAACHMFPDPALLDKQTWRTGVLPQMGLRLGLPAPSLSQEMSRSPQMVVLTKSVSPADWEKIVGYYVARAPVALAEQSRLVQPVVDPPFLRVGPFVPRLASSAIITLLKVDSVNGRIFVGEAASNTVRIFDYARRLKTTITLASAPTDVISERRRILVLASGNLAPNDDPSGSLVRYDMGPDGSAGPPTTVIDSLIRPVFVQAIDRPGGRQDFLICEFGNNGGRLALYRKTGSGYEREVLDASPGAIRFELRDMTGDGAPDVVALFAQGDERIVLFANDGTGRFIVPGRVLARFPPVYGSMYFTLADFNGDGKPDIVYVNGDNFDYSRVLKPYHGIRILENDGQNNFTERYFFPMYGAAHAVVADFNHDEKLDILATSNFADSLRHPEQGIVYLENRGGYAFQPYAFSVAAGGQWNVMASVDIDRNGRPDVLIGAMRLKSITQVSVGGPHTGREPPAILLVEDRLGPVKH